MRWQRRARIVVAVIGIASAIAIYAAMGERVRPTETPLPPRTDPSAMIESSGNVLQQVRGTKQDYLIEADRQLAYKDGATTLVGVRISVRNRGGRDFVLTSQEARAGENQKTLLLTGDVALVADDGFTVRADVATFSQDTGLVTAPGPVEFEGTRLRGSGTGMSYDENSDVLTLVDRSHVQVYDGDGGVSMEFTAGRAVFARREHRLELDGTVHALHGPRVIDAAESVVRLTDDEQRVTDVELSGGAQVGGGGSGIDVMRASVVTLAYGPDGDTLERVTLRGQASVTMSGQEGRSGLNLAGESLDLVLAPDGSLAESTGRDGVRLVLPASAGSSAKIVEAQQMQATGASGKGLTTATFVGAVEYLEDPGRGAPARSARSRRLSLALAEDEVEGAVFSGGATFEEDDVRAAAGEARYDPGKGLLRLSGIEGSVVPRVRDSRVTIDARTIDLTLAGRVIHAEGEVKTLLQAAPEGGGDGTKLPSLLRQDTPANVSAKALDYRGQAGQAEYEGNATLWQAETAIRANHIALDQRLGNLQASGDASSSIVLDAETSVGRAAEIEYADAERVLTYRSAARSGGVPAPRSQLNGPQGDLQGDRIEVRLAGSGGRIDRLDAHAGVTLRQDGRVVTGDQLSYFAGDERYVITGAAARPVSVVEGCKETTGKVLTFFRGSDRVIVDGNEEIRTQTKGAGPGCGPTPPAP